VEAPRFFVEGRREPGDLVEFSPGDARKIVTVLRMREGGIVEAIDSAGQRFDAALRIGEKKVRAMLVRRHAARSYALPEIAVAQAIPKGQKMDYVVEKLTELGVARILPIGTERTLGQAGPAKIERWRRLAKTASQQCGRERIPIIEEPLPFADLTESFGGYGCVLFPWELAAEEPLRNALPRLVTGCSPILTVVGPEGGFSHDEADRARAGGAHLISLGPRILRTETAALFLVSVLDYLVEGYTLPDGQAAERT
jgi:16S rRNA (uracil1498-N3)-methyltransferase